MTAKIIPFPSDRFRLTVQGNFDQPAKIIALRDRLPSGYSGESWAYELYVRASAFDSNEDRMEEAAEMYVLALSFNPDLAIAHTNLGNIRFRQGDEHSAIESYTEALRLDDRQPEALYNLGYIHLEQGDAHTAVGWLTKAVASDQRFADAQFNLATAHEQLGERAKARPHWKRYLELEPTGEWAAVAREELRRCGRKGKRR